MEFLDWCQRRKGLPYSGPVFGSIGLLQSVCSALLCFVTCGSWILIRHHFRVATMVHDASVLDTPPCREPSFIYRQRHSSLVQARNNHSRNFPSAPSRIEHIFSVASCEKQLDVFSEIRTLGWLCYGLFNWD